MSEQCFHTCNKCHMELSLWSKVSYNNSVLRRKLFFSLHLTASASFILSISPVKSILQHLMSDWENHTGGFPAQEETPSFLRDCQLFAGKLKQRTKYYMLMDICQKRQEYFQQTLSDTIRSAHLHFLWQREQSSPAAPLARLKFCLINLNYR